MCIIFCNNILKGCFFLLSDKIHNSFVLASDHAGYDLKEQIKFYLENNNFKVKDLGPFNNFSKESFEGGRHKRRVDKLN